MDLYTRTAMTSTRHSDLLREADDARLAAADRTTSSGATTSLIDALRKPAARFRNRLGGVAVRGTKHVTAHQNG